MRLKAHMVVRHSSGPLSGSGAAEASIPSRSDARENFHVGLTREIHDKARLVVTIQYVHVRSRDNRLGTQGQGDIGFDKTHQYFKPDTEDHCQYDGEGHACRAVHAFALLTYQSATTDII